jgi:glycosyltransferase involved in cell wall biosynthesis
MAHAPRVSGIIIFLNAEQFIIEAIESVFAQTYVHWELLLVDDGSSDGSPAIAQQYAAQYPKKVRYLTHQGHRNCGMSASRNLGISQARGEFVAFLDADDVWLPHKLAQQVAIFDAQPEAAMVYGRTLIWYSWTGKPSDLGRDHTLDLGVFPNTLVHPPTLFFHLLRNKVQTPTMCNAILRHRVFATIGGFEERFRGLYEDQAFFAKVHLKETVFVAGMCWAKYRQHPASCSAAASNTAVDYYTARLPFLNWLAEYLSAEGINRNPQVWQALQKELWSCRHPHWQRLRTLPRSLLWRMQNLLKMRPCAIGMNNDSNA